MLPNFKRPKGERAYYYSTTVENGRVVSHEGDEAHAMYKSEMREMDKRANRWHAWVTKNIPNAYDSIGIIDEAIYQENAEVCRQFLDGERKK